MEYPFKDLMPLDEVLEREGYYKDWTHLDPEVFYSLTQISNFIKTKGYGVDVRLLIAQLAEHFGLKTTQVVDLGNLLQQKFTNLEGVTQSFTNNINSLVAQMEAEKDAVIANATVDSEVILARGGKPTLQARLDDTTTQLERNKRLINDYVVNVKDYGAIGDGINRKLSDIYPSLEEAQEKYPFATSLENSLDWCGIYSAVLDVETNGFGKVFLPNGEYIVDFVIPINSPTVILGNGKEKVKIKLANQSRLFHNPTRNNDERSDDLNNLYRNYHAIFFVNDTDFEMRGITLDGNPENQTDTVGDVDYHFVYGDLTPGRNYFKYVHGIHVKYETSNIPVLKIKDSEISGFSWCNIQISAAHPHEYFPADVQIVNNTFGSSSHDQLNINRISGLSIEDNTFINGNTHSVHLYVDVSNASIKRNRFVQDDNIFYFEPRTTSSPRMIVLGHDQLTNFKVKDVLISENIFENNGSRIITPIVLYKNISRVRIERNKAYNAINGISVLGLVDGYNTFIDNEISYTSNGYSNRIFDGSDQLRKPDVINNPITSTWEIKNNTFIKLGDALGGTAIDLRTNGNTILNSEADVESVHYIIKNNIGDRYRMPELSEKLTVDLQDNIYDSSGAKIEEIHQWSRNNNSFSDDISKYNKDELTYRIVSASTAIDYPENRAGLVITYYTQLSDYTFEDFYIRFTNRVYRRWWNVAENKWSDFEQIM